MQPMSRRTGRYQYLLPLTLLLLWLGAACVLAEEEEAAEELTFVEALKDGTVKVSLRYRFEYVDDDNFGETAEASTLRTALSYRSGEWKGFSLFLEAEDVTALPDDDDYNNVGAGDLNNGVRGVPVVADPEVTDVNQAYLRWKNDAVQVSLGRQVINLGDQRFVGAVAWRQNFQTFDAARIEADLASNVGIDYTYADAVLRIFGDHIGMQSHFLNLPFTAAKGHKVTGYGYWLDYEVPTPLSTATYGVEYKGKLDLSDQLALNLELEAAEQQDNGDNPQDIDTEYRLASLGLQRGGLGLDVTWEVLGERGDGMRSFQTPLATLHKWNGWADKFLVTPSPGLETLYLRFKGKLADGWRFAVIYHDFTSDAGDIDYGTEIDAEVVYTAPWKQTFSVKYASYDADGFSSDTEKVWLWTSYSF